MPELSPDAVKYILPLPISSNRFYRNFNGRMVMSEEGRAYKANVKEILERDGVTPCTEEVAVWIDVYRARKSGDLDNRLKICLDALQGLLYVSDSQIIAINARRFDDAKFPRIEVTVQAAKVL